MQKLLNFAHPRKHARTPRRQQAVNVIGSAMAATAEADDLHSRSPRRRDPIHTILDHETVTRSDTQSLRSEEKKIRGRLGACHHKGAKDVRIEKSP